MPNDKPIPDSNGKYTYSDYITWPEGERWEIFDGVPYMQTAPSWQHQSISGELYRQFANYLINNPCRVFAAPFNLCIPELNEMDEKISTILQPDIVVICDENKLRKSGYFGTPELIIEITSPSTAKNDKLIKFNKFEQAGVKEYWIVEPEEKIVSVFMLQENNRYSRPGVYADDDKINVSIFPDLTIDLESVFSGI